MIFFFEKNVFIIEIKGSFIVIHGSNNGGDEITVTGPASIKQVYVSITKHGIT